MSKKYFVLIPAFQPDERLIELVENLIAENYRNIVVVDDGNLGLKKADDYRKIFDRVQELGAIVLHREERGGKGVSLKAGFAFIQENYKECEGVITADCDGQHLIKDIVAVAKTLEENPDKLILGSRKLYGKGLPFNSWFGNAIAIMFFKVTTGLSCRDALSGLRGIPKELFDLAVSDDGNRYEYELNFLTDAVAKVKLIQVPITAVFDRHRKTSHFRPIRDTFLLYGRLMRFIISGVTSFLIDYGVFLLLNYFMVKGGIKFAGSVFAATAAARFLASLVNFLMNHFWSFKGKSHTRSIIQFVKYIALWAVLVGLGFLFVYLLGLAHVPVELSKFLVDLALFFLNYFVQQNWVFV